MYTILILTVGGSCRPIVNAILKERPDFVYFICSSGSKGSQITVDGPGKPCEEESPSIVEQVGLKNSQYQKWQLDDPDDFRYCYEKITELAREIKERFKDENIRIIANYTGGTKTMSVALTLVALIEEDWDLQLNKGPRVDLIKVREGDVPILVNKWNIFADHVLNSIKQNWQKYDYSSAAELSSNILGKTYLSENRQAQFQNIFSISEAFDAWDKFDHKRAYEGILPYARYFVDHKKALEHLIGRSRKPSYYKLIGDIIRNAERRAKQSRYDDAVARLYRALELFAQIRLKEILNIDWDPLKDKKIPFQINLSLIPTNLRSKYEVYSDGEYLKIGLVQDYELLSDLNDLVGSYFQQNKNELLDSLKLRNYSILAHGLNPLNESDYGKIYQRITNFISQVAEKLNVDIYVPQLPSSIPKTLLEV